MGAGEGLALSATVVARVIQSGVELKRMLALTGNLGNWRIRPATLGGSAPRVGTIGYPACGCRVTPMGVLLEALSHVVRPVWAEQRS
jgi:hypothetical protein